MPRAAVALLVLLSAGRVRAQMAILTPTPSFTPIRSPTLNSAPANPPSMPGQPYPWDTRPQDYYDCNRDINVRTLSDATALRRAWTQYVWGTDTIPSRTADVVTTNVAPDVLGPDDAAPIGNLDHVDRYSVNMTVEGHGVHDNILHYFPKTTNTAHPHLLWVVHDGSQYSYQGFWDDGMGETVRFWLALGYPVLQEYHLNLGFNSVDGLVHNDLSGLYNGFFGPQGVMRAAYESEIVALNTAIARFGYTEVAMTGVSGGGGQTRFQSMIDTRIGWSYPANGVVEYCTMPGLYAGVGPYPPANTMLCPLPATQYNCPNTWWWAEFNSQAADTSPLGGQLKSTFLDEATLAVVPKGRRQINMQNFNDPTGHRGMLDKVIQGPAQIAMAEAGAAGDVPFSVVIDPYSNSHQISALHRAIMVEELAGVRVMSTGDYGFHFGGDFASVTRGEWPFTTGYQGYYAVAPAGTHLGSSTFTFTDLTPATYVISATWGPLGGLSTAAAFSISLDDGTPIPVTVNQAIPTWNRTSRGMSWHDLVPAGIVQNKVVVTLVDDSVTASAIRLEPIGPAGSPRPTMTPTTGLTPTSVATPTFLPTQFPFSCPQPIGPPPLP